MFGAQGLVSRNTQTNGLSPSGTLWYAFDERGNVAQRTGSGGGVASSDLYDGFGNVTRTGGPDVFGFGGQAGYYTDAETGLILCTHRHYDPQSGRFLTRDPLGYDGGINLYSYTANNPVNWLDPSGHGIMAGLGGAGGLRLVNTLRLASTLTTIQDIKEAAPETTQTQVSQMAEQLVEKTPDAGPDRMLEGAESEEVGSDIAVDQAARNGWTYSLKCAGGATEGVSTAAEGAAAAGEGATAAEGAAVGLGAVAVPVVVITAGAVAVGDLGTYIVTGKAKGPFTRFGSWLADQLFPGPDGLPASASPRRRGCR